MRGVNYPKSLVNLVSRDPDDVVRPIHDERHRVASLTGDLPVASKSGSLDHLRSDVGIVYARGGRVALPAVAVSVTLDTVTVVVAVLLKTLAVPL